MKTEPPTGDDLTAFVTEVKTRVLRDTATPPPRRRRFTLTTLAVSGIAVLAIGTAGTAIATSIGENVSYHAIPSTMSRPGDPLPPEDYSQGANNTLTADEASLAQLWAGIATDMEDTDPSNTHDDFRPNMSNTDYIAAIAARCYPQLTAEDVATLETHRVAYETQTGAAGYAAARAHFELSTTLCM